MTYRIWPAKPLTGEVVRIAEIQYVRAIEILRDQREGPHEAIHDARKRFKRLRGLFRLVRDADSKFCGRENARARDIARTLSAVRNATALTEALDRLLATEATAENHTTLLAIRNRLAARRNRIASEEADLPGKMAAAIACCEDGIKALSKLRLPAKQDKAVALLAKGTASNYGRAARALEKATENGDAADWHDLRKRIKYHRMHVQLLSRAWPGEMAIRADVADIAGEALGDDHDLAALSNLIAAEPDAIGTDKDMAILHACMTARSARLHEQISDTVKNLLQDDPSVIRSRIAALYRDAGRCGVY